MNQLQINIIEIIEKFRQDLYDQVSQNPTTLSPQENSHSIYFYNYRASGLRTCKNIIELISYNSYCDPIDVICSELDCCVMSEDIYGQKVLNEILKIIKGEISL